MAGIIDLVGNTPLVEITRLNPNPKVKIYAKLEGNNPGGSVKDRAALNMIRSALERGEINKNTKLIEATSGNTGIALAMIASVYGIEIELVMPLVQRSLYWMELSFAATMLKKKQPMAQVFNSINLPTLIIFGHIIKLPAQKCGEIPNKK